MNRLRGFSVGAAGALFVFAVWGTLYYQHGAVTTAFAFAAGTGLFVLVLPMAVRRLRLYFQRRRQRERRTTRGTQAGVVFVSQDSVKKGTIDRLYDLFVNRDDFDPSVDQFSEGRGLTIVHSGFHNTFVRITETGQLAVTGGSEKTRRIVDVIVNSTDYQFEERDSNPMLRPRPIDGKMRVMLWLLISALLFTGLSVGTTGAYSGHTYNSAERMVLIGLDGRGSIDPNTTLAETKLAKADFLVQVLNETSVEIRWERNRSSKIVHHAEQAVAIARDVDRLLAQAEASGLSSSQTTHANRVREQRDVTSRNVSNTIKFVIEHHQVNDSDVERLKFLREQLLANATHASTDTRKANALSATRHFVADAENRIASSNLVSSGSRVADRDVDAFPVRLQAVSDARLGRRVNGSMDLVPAMAQRHRPRVASESIDRTPNNSVREYTVFAKIKDRGIQFGNIWQALVSKM